MEKTYVAILKDTLDVKLSILEEILQVTRLQEKFIRTGRENSPEFETTMGDKDNLIEKLNLAEDGFETLYTKAKEEMLAHKEQYRDEVLQMQDLIPKITDISVELQSLEQKNKAQMEQYFQKKGKEIGDRRFTKRSADAYYNNMSQHKNGQSYFVDKKK